MFDSCAASLFWSWFLMSSLHLNNCAVGYNNGGADYDDENGYLQEAPQGYRGRGRGRGRRGPGRGYGGNNYAMEEAGGYNDGEDYNAPPTQGLG
jgi:hypothetical protein